MSAYRYNLSVQLPQSVSVMATEKSENQRYWSVGEAQDESEPVIPISTGCEPYGRRRLTSKERLEMEALHAGSRSLWVTQYQSLRVQD